jgi:hypothetical protein
LLLVCSGREWTLNEHAVGISSAVSVRTRYCRSLSQLILGANFHDLHRFPTQAAPSEADVAGMGLASGRTMAAADGSHRLVEPGSHIGDLK